MSCSNGKQEAIDLGLGLIVITLARKFATKRSLQMPPHLNGADTLPCEILMSENIACPIRWSTVF